MSFRKWLVNKLDLMRCPMDLSKRVNEDSDLEWVLYDLDLLPEQITTGREVSALRGFIYGWDSSRKMLEARKTHDQL